MAEPCVTLWIGDRLGPVERACMASVVRQGHKLALYCYRRFDNVPAGVEVRDANDVLPERLVIRHRNGSVGLFADRFRYELQRRNQGIWVDADIYLLKPIPGHRSYLFGRQGTIINSAVLRLPPHCPALDDMIALFDDRQVPFWLPLRSRVAARARLIATGRAGLAAMPWGTFGPHGLTALLRKYGLDHHALPEPVFYPVRWQDAAWILDPDVRLEDRIGPATIGLHLWNERIRSFKDEPAPPESFLARLQREGSR